MMLTPVILALLLWFCGSPIEPQINAFRKSVSKVEIVKPPTGQVIDSLTLQVGDTGSVACKVTNQYGSVLKRACSWVALTTTRATVSPATGEATNVRAVGIGTTRAIASTAGKADTIWVVVTDGSIPQPVGTGVQIAPGESWQAKVDANSPGTVFRPLAGTHIRQSVIPKTGDEFRCQPGAVMDGENVTNYAFQITPSAPYPDSVQIVGCKITRYHPPDGSQMAAIRGSGDDIVNGKIVNTGRWWVVDSNEVSYSSQVGIRIGNQMKVRGNNVHHNGTFGISGPGDSVLVEGNTVTDNGSATLESGQTKFVLTTGLVLRGNTVRRGLGPGLWGDIANRDYIIENNLVEDTRQEGIVVEISYGGKICNNTVRRAGLDDPRADDWLWGAGIGVHASGGTGIEICGNTLEGNAYGIVLHQQHRGCAYPGEPPCTMIDAEMYTQNVYAHDNAIVEQTVPGHLHAGSLGASQVAQDFVSTPSIFDRNNRFENNSYVLNGQAFPFAWQYGYRSVTQWRGYGMDLTGAVTP